MASQTLLTNYSKSYQAEQMYYAPVAVLPPPIGTQINTMYCFLSKVDPWADDNNPPTPTQDQKYIKQTFKNMFVAKEVTSNDVIPVIKRYDWTTGTNYDYYRDDIDMFETDVNGNPVYVYYVKNRYDQVFKCLWNNNGGDSTSEPFFEPGSYGNNGIFVGADGYKWKFMFTVDLGQKVKFMDSNWIPVSVSSNTPNPIITSAGCGSIDVINVTNGGTGYDPANALITITVTGDGTGANAYAEVSNGVITDIIVTDEGTNYTYANVSITSSVGANAVALSPTSPVGGHGFDPVSELGCSNVMLSISFDGSESGVIPTNIDFHQFGLLVSPTTRQLSPIPANGTIYSVSTDLVVASGFGAYVEDEIVYQGDSLENATFTGTVLTFDEASNVIKLINTTGTMTLNAPIFGDSSKTTRTLLSYSTPNFVPFSGYMIYIENRSAIQRSADGIEQIKIVLGY